MDFIEAWEMYEEFLFYSALEVQEVLEGLSTIISTSQKPFTWYLNLNWRSISEKQFLSIALLIMYMRNHPTIYETLEELEVYIWTEFEEQFLLHTKKFQEEKTSIWSQMIQSRIEVSIMYLIVNRITLPITEWKGNYSKSLRGWFKKNLTIRYNTPRNLKRQERVRGYRDHGSMPTKSQVARRRANELSSFGFTQEGYNVTDDILQFWEEQETKRKPDSS